MQIWPVRSLKINLSMVFLILIVLLGLTLRIYNLEYKSLWLDETESLFYAERSLNYIIFGRGGVEAFVAPIYYIILHFFLALGQSEFILRIPSVIFGVLAIILIYYIGKTLFGKREGLISAFLLSISTLHINFSQEARMYSLSMFLALLSFFLFYKSYKENNKKLWIGLLFSISLGILSHYFMLFIPIILGIFIIFMFIKNRFLVFFEEKKVDSKKNVLLILALIIITIFLILLLQQAFLGILNLMKAYYPNISWGLKPNSFFEDLFSQFAADRFLLFSFQLDAYLIYYFLNIIILFVLTFSLGLITSLKKYGDQTILMFIWFFFPTITVFVLTISLNTPIVDVKYLIFILPCYLLGVSRGICSLAKGWIKYFGDVFPKISSFSLSMRVSTVALVIILIFAGLSVVPLQKYYSWKRNDWRATAEYLEANSISSDFIIVEPRFGLGPLLYYYNMDLMETTVLSTHQSIDEIKNIYATHDRVWSVLGVTEVEIEDLVSRNSIELKSFAGITIYYRSYEQIYVSVNEMSFVGLDSHHDELAAVFYHNDDTATFTIDIPEATNYTVALHAQSWVMSALELVIDGESKGVKTFFNGDWRYENLGTYYMDIGLHEIILINREGGGLGDTDAVFDQVAFWPN